jgi:hypothetical protein
MIDPAALEAARRLLAGKRPGGWTLDKIDETVLDSDEISVSLTEAILAATKLARAAAQEREEVVEECVASLRAYADKWDAEDDPGYASAMRMASEYIRSMKKP